MATFRMTWNGSSVVLYMNGAVAVSYPYTPVTPGWTPSASFTIGYIDEYLQRRILRDGGLCGGLRDQVE